MPQPEGKATRRWQDIAEEAAHEQNPEKLIRLTKELELAFEERDGKVKKLATGESA